jgi:NTE family protein
MLRNEQRLRQMSTFDSSVANDDLGRDDAAQADDAAQVKAESARTSASALLAACDIWSTASVATTPTEAAVVTKVPEKADVLEKAAPPRALRPSELLARAKAACSSAQYAVEPQAESKTAFQPRAIEPPQWPPRKLSLALQGGGTFAAFTWGVLDRLLQEPDLTFDAISGSSAGAVNAVLLACGLAEGGRDHARALLAHFWNRTINGTSFRQLMLIGGLSPASTSVSFGSGLRLSSFDPLDLNPLRQELLESINFAALRTAASPKLLIAATRVRDGRPQIFRNADITTDVVLASTCPPALLSAVEIGDEAFWDGGHSANPPLVRLVQESESADLLVVQAVPSRDDGVPTTAAAIDRRLDQIAANAALQAEIAAIEWARDISTSLHRFRLHRIAAEDEVEGLAQQSCTEIERDFIALLRERGHAAAERWLRRGAEQKVPRVPEPWDYVAAALQSLTEARL